MRQDQVSVRPQTRVLAVYRGGSMDLRDAKEEETAGFAYGLDV